MFYVGLSAQFPLLTMSLGRRVLKGWELAYKISQFSGGEKSFYFIVFVFATSSPTHSPPSSALSACVYFFCCFYSRSSSRFFSTSLSPTPILVSNLLAHSILIRIYWTFIRDERKRRVPPSPNGNKRRTVNDGNDHRVHAISEAAICVLSISALPKAR